MFDINIFAVIVAAIVAFVLGFLFHGPVGGKLWMKLADIHPTGNEKLSDMVPQMLWNLLVNFVTAYVLAVFISLASTSPALAGTGVWLGISCGLLAWLGFLVTTTSINVIWMKASVKLWLYESACSFIVMAVIGAILASWS